MVSLTIGQKKSRTMKNVSGLYVPVCIFPVYLNTTKTPKLRKDAQRHAKTHKDTQRRAKTRKEAQRRGKRRDGTKTPTLRKDFKNTQ